MSNPEEIARQIWRTKGGDNDKDWDGQVFEGKATSEDLLKIMRGSEPNLTMSVWKYRKWETTQDNHYQPETDTWFGYIFLVFVNKKWTHLDWEEVKKAQRNGVRDICPFPEKVGEIVGNLLWWPVKSSLEEDTDAADRTARDYFGADYVANRGPHRWRRLLGYQSEHEYNIERRVRVYMTGHAEGDENGETKKEKRFLVGVRNGDKNWNFLTLEDFETNKPIPN